MTKEEAYKHEWHDGEKIWAVMHKYLSIPEQDSYGAMPIEVKEITVKKAERNTYCNTTFLKIYFDVDDKMYSCWNDYLGIDCDHDFCILTYNTDRLCCDSKFFDKESAEKEFIRQKAEFEKFLNKCKKDIIESIEHAHAEIKKLTEDCERMEKGIMTIDGQIERFKNKR